jgi:orotate phosphoribosyltransferase
VSLFEQGDFTLHSGGHSKYRINCERLTDEDIAMVAHRLGAMLPRFGQIVAIPEGGIRLGTALVPYIIEGHVAALIVDDVWTTGFSMLEARKAVLQEAPKIDVWGTVIFKRGTAPLPSWVVPFADIYI